jgi:ABC-type polysaccharide/polyol phosphate transport system ATPase subunit
MSSQATSYSPPATSSTADQEVLVKVEGVSKKFCRSLKKSLWYGVCDIAGELSPFGRRPRVASSESLVTSPSQSASGGSIIPATSYPPPVTPDGLRPGEFWAVNDVSFELRRGECLGLIGHNGAGKTTLLKMLNGLIKPDTGRIEMNGRVGALIALGAGFNPILTGRENIYINGSVLGLSKKEIDEKIDEIIDFAEIGEFIDMPVQNYSSGMQVRLGFAVATALEPDVILADEILAVGDVAFRAKCYRRLAALLKRGVAVIFVSHDLQSVERLTKKCIWLQQGACKLAGKTSEVIPEFQVWADSVQPLVSNAVELGSFNKSVKALEARILAATVLDAQGQPAKRVESGCEVRIRVLYEVGSTLKSGIQLSITLRTNDLSVYTGHTTFDDRITLNPEAGRYTVDLVYPEFCLGSGRYILSVALLCGDNIGVYDHNTDIGILEVTSKQSFTGRFYMPHLWHDTTNTAM